MVVIAHIAHIVRTKWYSQNSLLHWCGLFLTFTLLLDCLIRLPVDIMPEFMINSLSFVTRYPTPFDQDPEYSGESAFCSDPIRMCVYLQANYLRDIFQRFGFIFAMRKDCKNSFMGHYADQIFTLLSAGQTMLVG
jgi:hypothetical protein